ncbi:MAG: short-chain dehydrogenase/reductase [Actinomycetia bacterium]|nr:short-chain dehydrogenase/reductase [Actinomycetes bacterium]
MTALDDSPVPDYLGRLRLDGTGFIVVGAGQGMGRQTAHALAAAGARVVCADLERDRAEAVAAEVDGIPWCGDVVQRPEAERLFTEAEAALGRIGGVVDIVGMARIGRLVDIDDATWDGQHDIVLRHAFLVTQLAGRAMARSGGGVLVFIASVSGVVGADGAAAYGAAKAGLISLVRSAAVELGPSNIRVNAVAPGTIWTPRVSVSMGDAGRARNVAVTPLGRVGETSDIASVILFLASDLSAFVTGQTLVADGGVTSRNPFPIPDEP